MAAALRAAKGGIFFQISQGGIFKIIPARGVNLLPPIPDPWLTAILFGIEMIQQTCLADSISYACP